ncbi:MAG TPA: ATP synthase F0 subunit B [Candidatus Baltobacteraceae bacterium]|nr:ATP synthase F0 subunit B [Candidatus Baltobacteraceae bacterium]
MFLSINGTFLVQIVNFVVFYAILNVVFLRPVQRAIAKRREYIESLTQDYDAAQAQAAQLRADAEHVRAEARREADHVLAAARNEGGNEAAKIASEYMQRVRTIVEDAHRTVAGEVEALRPREGSLAEELAQSIVARVVPELTA